MKRVIVLVTVILVAVMTSNAQYFVSGSVGMDFTSGKSKIGNTSTDHPSTFLFNISPSLGYYLNDKFAIGVEAGIERLAENYKNSSKQKYFATTWGIGALARYHLVEVNDITLLLKGTLGFQSYKEKSKYSTTSYEDDPVNLIGLFVLPALSYNLTERLSIEVDCDFLRLGCFRYSQKSGNTKTIGNYFGFGANYGDSEVLKSYMSNIFAIGIVYKF